MTDEDHPDRANDEVVDGTDSLAAGGTDGEPLEIPDDDAADAPGADRRIPEPVEPGSPTLENALFVLLGVLAALAVLFHLVSLAGG